jgi:hypothetical protein
MTPVPVVSFPHAVGGNPDASRQALVIFTLDARQKHSGMTMVGDAFTIGMH